MEKTCTHCSTPKDLSCFYLSKSGAFGVVARCKECSYILNKKYKSDPSVKEMYRLNNSKYYNENKKEHAQRGKEWVDKNKEKRLEICKKYREKHLHKITENRISYVKENKEKVKRYAREYNKSRESKDNLFKFKNRIKARVKMFYKKRNMNYSSIEVVLGADYNTAKKHLERQFKKGMTWQNHGEWHIDHIIPLASAKTEEDVIKLCHYTNLQPLWAKENIKKRDKFINPIQMKITI